MASTVDRPPRTRRWAVRLPLAVAVLAAVYAVLNALVHSAYLITGRHLLVGPHLDGRLTTSSLPQVTNGWVPPLGNEYLLDLPQWLRWLSAAPTLLHALTLTVATALTVTAIHRLAAATSGTATARPWKVLAAVLLIGGLAQGLVDTAAVQALRAQHHESVMFDSALITAVIAMPWSTIVLGVLSTAIAAALTTRNAQREDAGARPPG